MAGKEIRTGYPSRHRGLVSVQQTSKPVVVSKVKLVKDRTYKYLKWRVKSIKEI